MRLIVRRSSPAQRHLAQAIGLGERLMPADGSIDGFVAAVGAHRGRSVRVIGYPLDAAGPSGLWIGTCASDYVVCSADATPTRRAAILCHELAHMLLGHEPEVGDIEALSLVAKVLAPDVDASVATRLSTDLAGGTVVGLAHSAPDQDNVRRALGSFAAGVTVISTRDTDEQPVGMTATAFTSVSFSPPSVLTCLSLGARTHEYVRSHGRFGVNLLGADGQGLSDYCASPGQDKVLPANWLDEQGGWESPCLNGAMAFFDCGVIEAVETGTHVIVIGSVLGVGFSPLRDSTSPLLHFRGSYRRLSPLSRGSAPNPLPIVFDDSPDHGGPLV